MFLLLLKVLKLNHFGAYVIWVFLDSIGLGARPDDKGARKVYSCLNKNITSWTDHIWITKKTFKVSKPCLLQQA